MKTLAEHLAHYQKQGKRPDWLRGFERKWHEVGNKLKRKTNGKTKTAK